MKKQVLIACMFIVLLPYGQAQEGKYAKQIESIIAHLNARNTAGLLGMMADTARIGNLPAMDNSKVLPEILSNFNPITDYKIVGEVTQEMGNRLISLMVTYADGKSGKPTMTFNRSGRLVNLGIIKARLKGNPEKALSDAVLAAVKPDTIRIAFEMQNGLIYVPAKLNGKDGYFMFDSGAPVLILRKKFIADEYISKDVTVDFTGMGGMMSDVQWATGNTLAWGGLHLSGLDAPVAAMNDMELDNAVPIFGLMGYGILHGYQLTFDYTKKELLLERVDEMGNLLGASFNKGPIASSAAMRMRRHIPIVDIVVGENSYPMGIDCGANANVMKAQTAESLKSFMDYEDGKVAINGVGGPENDNSVGFLMHSMIGTVPLDDMYTAVTDQAIGGGSGDEALPIVGLLGTPFLMQYKMTLNFNKGEISFYKKDT